MAVNQEVATRAGGFGSGFQGKEEVNSHSGGSPSVEQQP